MNRQEVEQAYTAKGLEIEHGNDEAGKVYEPHRHEKTYLYTLGGSLRIKTEGNDWTVVVPGLEFVVEADQLHEAVVGNDGWEYVAAWNKEEAQRHKH